MDLITFPLEDKAPQTQRSKKIALELERIKEVLTDNNWPLKKINNRELWQIGKGDNIYLLSYSFQDVWFLFPSNEELVSMLVTALSTTDVSRKTA